MRRITFEFISKTPKLPTARYHLTRTLLSFSSLFLLLFRSDAGNVDDIVDYENKDARWSLSDLPSCKTGKKQND